MKRDYLDKGGSYRCRSPQGERGLKPDDYISDLEAG